MTSELDRLGDNLLGVRRRQARAERTPSNSSPLPIFDAVASTNQSIAQLAIVPVVCDLVTLDTEGARLPLDPLDTTSALTDRWVCRVDGVYEVAGAVSFGNVAGQWRAAWWRKNTIDISGSVARIGGAPVATGVVATTPTRAVECVAGDYLQLVAQHNTSANLIVDGAIRSGMYIKKTRNLAGG